MTPAELRSKPQWILWRYETKRGYPKPAKVPYAVKGHRASTMNPDHCSTYNDVEIEFVESGGFYDGIGFVLGGGICGFDLDDCIRDGNPGTTLEKAIAENRMSDFAQTIIREANTYVEISPSGTGIKGFCTGDVQTAYKRKLDDGSGVEVYAAGRYFTVTGKGEDRPLAPLPAMLALPPATDKESNDKPPAYEACHERIMSMPDSISGERGHDAIFAVCCEIARWGLADEYAWEIANKFNDEKAEPPWDAKDLKRKLKEGRKRVTNDGEIGVRLHENTDLNSFDVIAQSTPATADAEPAYKWDHDMDPDGFKSCIGKYALENDPYTEADKNAVVAHKETIAGNWFNRGAYVKLDRDRHHTKLNKVFVATSGEGRKGAAYSNAVAPFADADKYYVENRIRRGYASGQAIIVDLADPTEGEKELQESLPVVDDFVEVLPNGAEAPADQKLLDCDKRRIWLATEFANTLANVSNEASIASMVCRDSFDDVPLGNVTKFEKYVATMTHLSILGHITPEELALKMPTSEIYNGFANRFEWIFCQRRKIISQYTKVPPRERAIAEERRAAITSTCTRQLLEAYKWLEKGQPGGAGYSPVHDGVEFHFGDSGRERMQAFKDEIERDLPLSPIAALFARAEQIVVRKALLYAVLDQSQTIEERHVLPAIAQWWYSKRSTDFIFSSVVKNTIHPELVAWMRRRGGTVTLREIGQLAPMKYRTAEKRDKAIAELLAAKIGVWGEWLTNKPGSPVQQFRLL